MSTRPAPRSRIEDAAALLCNVAGARDLPSYLGLSPDYTPRDALAALERKRRELESLLGDPRYAREHEVFDRSWSLLRDALLTPEDAVVDAPASKPIDHYAVLGVQPTASFLTIERAYRALKAIDRDTADVKQAWRVLGDPLNRAHFDRSRREDAVRTRPDTRPPEPTSPGIERSASGRTVAEIPGPSLRDVHLDEAGDRITIRTVPIVVRGDGVWRMRIVLDHPCLSTIPDGALRLRDGRHALTVRIDPTALTRRTTTCTITLSSPREQHVIAFRIHKPPPRTTSWRPLTLAASALLLIAAGGLLGQRMTVSTPERTPASLGTLDQIPAVHRCFSDETGPFPAHVDIHVDGLGRPTGFSIEGLASPGNEACVRDALRRLEFPPTRTGLPAFHRYRMQPATLRRAQSTVPLPP